MDAKRIDIPRGVDPVVLLELQTAFELLKTAPQVRYLTESYALSMIGLKGIIDIARWSKS